MIQQQKLFSPRSSKILYNEKYTHDSFYALLLPFMFVHVGYLVLLEAQN